MPKINQKSKENNMSTIKEKTPIKEYQESGFKKTIITRKLEKILIDLNIDDKTTNKLINSALKILSTLNPKEEIPDIEVLINNLKFIRNLSELKSTLRLISAKLNDRLKPKEDVKNKEKNRSCKLDKNRLMIILFNLKALNEQKFFKIFYALSILSYTKDKNVLAHINNLNDEDLVDYAVKNAMYISFDNPHLTNLYPYGGGKQKFIEFLNQHLKLTLDTQKVDTFIDLFLGGAGSFYSGFRQIKKNQLNVVLNDLNPSILNLNKNVQSKSKHKKMMKYIAMLVQKMFLKYDTYELTHEQYKEFHIRINKVLNHIEKTNKNSVFASSILLFILNNGFGGNYKMTKKGSYISPSTDENKYVRFFNFVGKIELYHFLYNSVDVKFENKDYKTIMKKYCSSPTTYTTIDPPYINRNNMSVEEYTAEMTRLKKLEKSACREHNKRQTTKTKKAVEKYQKEQHQLLKGCVFNYGIFGDTFGHEQLLKDLLLIKGEMSYFNYPHPIIEKYSEEYGLNIDLLGRKSTNGCTKAGENIKTKYEVFMTGKISSISDKKNIQKVS